MASATLYKIHKKGYLLFASVKTTSGFRIGVEPYIRIQEEAGANAIGNAIKAVLSFDDNKRVPDPKNWSEFDKLFLQKTGLKSMKELNQSTTKNINVRRDSNTIVFTPSKHAEKPDEGFLYGSRDTVITISFTASDEEIVEAIELALNKCD